MPAPFTGTVAYGSPGNKSVYVGFPAKGFRITIDQKYNATFYFPQRSTGESNGTVQHVSSFYQDVPSAPFFYNSSSKLISFYDKVNGVRTEVITGTTLPMSGNTINFNLSKASAKFNMLIEAW